MLNKPEDLEPELLALKRRARVRDRPKRKLGAIRWLWPEIRAALDHGYSILEIQAGLTDAGIHIHYKNLTLQIRRLRLEDKNRPTAAPVNPAPHSWEGQSGNNDSPRQAAEKSTHDPLLNLRDMRAKQTTWEYKPPTAEDKDKLI